MLSVGSTRSSQTLKPSRPRSPCRQKGPDPSGLGMRSHNTQHRALKTPPGRPQRPRGLPREPEDQMPQRPLPAPRGLLRGESSVSLCAAGSGGDGGGGGGRRGAGDLGRGRCSPTSPQVCIPRVPGKGASAENSPAPNSLVEGVLQWGLWCALPGGPHPRGSMRHQALFSLQRHLSPRVFPRCRMGPVPSLLMGDLGLPGASHASSGRPNP